MSEGGGNLFRFCVRALKVLRFAWILQLGAASILLVTDQGRELVRAAADTPFKTLWFALALLAQGLSAWLWSRKTLDLFGPDLAAVRPAGGLRGCIAFVFERWLPRGLGALLPASAAYIAISLGLIALGVIAAAVAALLLAFFVLRRPLTRRLVRGLPPLLAAHLDIDAPPAPGPRLRGFLAVPGNRTALLILALHAAFAIAVAVWWVPEFGPAHAQFFGPAAIAFLWLGLVFPLGMALTVAGGLVRLPVMSFAIVAVVLLSTVGDLYDVRVLPRPAAAPPRAEAAPAGETCTPTIDAPTELQRYACAWARARVRAALAGNLAPNDVFPVLLVSAEGGGIRGAAWPAFVLARLLDGAASPDGPASPAQRLFAMSGASGGSLGSATIVAALAERRAGARCTGPRGLTACAEAFLSSDFLSGVLAAFLYTDTVRPLARYAIDLQDRGVALERSWERAWPGVAGDDRGRFAESLDALYAGGAASDPPLLFLNSTQVHDGRRAIAAPASVRPVDTEPRGLLLGFDQAVDLAGVAGAPMRLSTAVGLSARFPVVTPVGVIGQTITVVGADGRSETSARLRQFADGGYFDNSGTATLADVVAALPRAVTLQDAGGRVRVVQLPRIVLHFVNDPEQYEFHEARLDTLPEPGLGTAQALGPLGAITSTRSARSYFSRQIFQHAAADTCAAAVDGRTTAFVPIALSRGKDDPELVLGWLLSSNARRRIAEAADVAATALAAALGPALNDPTALTQLCNTAARPTPNPPRAGPATR